MTKSLTAFSANPFVFIFSAVLLLAVVLYFSWGTLDRFALSDERASAVVTGKRYNPPGTTYRTNIAGGRAWTMVDATPDAYVVSLTVGPELSAAVVSKELHDALKVGDSVTLRVQRTRFTKQLLVVEVSR
jgi:hypothetical protein